ncbi:glycosyltransferase [Actinomadura nitritigenes]|uniref:glycosyltransferase n=1 Tax=Actinomadura nitritigenes TaxID=134602 RepID=UPI003D91851E
MSPLTDHTSLYGLAVGSVLLAKLLLSIPFRRRADPFARPQPASRASVTALITVYNEDPRILHDCLESLFRQTRVPDQIVVIDDGSDAADAADAATRVAPYFHGQGIGFQVIRYLRNRGKRHALAVGVRAAWDAEVYLCVDSDTVLARTAIEEAMRPMASRRVMCVTGLVLALNRSRNLLTRLIDMRYVNAFLGERVAYSRLGSVLCACGSMALYRGWVVRKNLSDFLTQTWLGAPANAGDDRRLTYYCLMEGRAVIQPRAVAWTAVPENMTHYLKQQTRWTKSFIREGILMVATSPLRVCWWLNLVELATWVAFTSALLVALAAFALHPHWWTVAAGYFTYMCAMSWLRSLHYLRGAAGVPLPDRIGTFLAAPLYALMNLTMLIPLRFCAIATIRNAAWGTRSGGVEVAHHSGHQAGQRSPVRSAA